MRGSFINLMICSIHSRPKKVKVGCSLGDNEFIWGIRGQLAMFSYVFFISWERMAFHIASQVVVWSYDRLQHKHLWSYPTRKVRTSTVCKPSAMVCNRQQLSSPALRVLSSSSSGSFAKQTSSESTLGIEGQSGLLKNQMVRTHCGKHRNYFKKLEDCIWSPRLSSSLVK